MRKFVAPVLFLLAVSISAQEAPYPVFETDNIPPAEFKQRRESLKSQLGPGSLAIFFTNPTRNRNNDVDYLYRGDSNFLYLTGFEEPDAALVLIPGGIEINGKRVTEALFVNVSTAMSITWLGYRMGPANAEKLLGIQMALPNSEFASVLPKLTGASSKKTVVTTRVPSDASGTLGKMISDYAKWRDENQLTQSGAASQMLSRMRGVKSAEEIRILKKVCHNAAMAHVEAMRSIEPRMREWEIAALVQYIFAKEGCEYTGYPPIVGSGPNSTILHYDANRRLMLSGDIVCMDTAGEYHGYSADVTRSFPVNGKFTPEQKAIYNVVYAAQEAGINACTVGNTTGAIGRICSDKLAEGMMKLGIIKDANELRRYYMHGFGHGIGLDVHDPMPGTLVPGVVLTVEPGIYIKDGSPCDQKWWNIGIRIEDDILVTQSGPVNLSAAAPRTVEAIEKLMAEKGIGNVAQKPVGK